MELDQYDLSGLDDLDTTPKEYRVPNKAKFYPPNKTVDLISLLPLDYVLRNNAVQAALIQLRRSQISHKDLPDDLKSLKTKFKSNVALAPVKVRASTAIIEPSRTDPTRPNLLGYGSPMIVHYPILTDYLYEVLNHPELVALSIYYGYDHIPVILV